MARYYEGVNGSMQGTAGGVNVYNWQGLWLQRARRKSALSFVPTGKQQIVITNFTTMSKALTPYALGFKYGFPKPPKGMTSRALATKVNFASQMNGTAGGSLINFNPAKVVMTDGALGYFGVTVTHARDNQFSLGWVRPAIDSPLYGGEICILAIDEDNGESRFFTASSTAESATVSLYGMNTGPDLGRVYIWLRTLEGATQAIVDVYDWGANP